MSSPKKPSARAARRSSERAASKLVAQRERLAALEPGGSAEYPIEVSSSSLVESRARSVRCLRCDDEMRLDEHEALTVGERRLRLARLSCRSCGARRDLYFKLGTTLAS